MNWAGYAASNSSLLRCGAPNWANGIAPESYQTSITSGTRRACASQDGQPKVTSSTNGRCGSRADRSCPACWPSSASEPTHVRCPSAHRQIGSGVPQYRLRDSAQSTLLASQSPYRPVLMPDGCQSVRSFSASSCSAIAVVRMYQLGSA